MKKLLVILDCLLLMIVLTSCVGQNMEAIEQSKDPTNEMTEANSQLLNDKTEDQYTGQTGDGQQAVDNEQIESSQPYETRSPSYYWSYERTEMIKKLRDKPQRFEIPRIPGKSPGYYWSDEHKEIMKNLEGAP